MTQPHLLPQNATAFEIAFARASDPVERQGVAVANSLALQRRTVVPPAFVPHLLYELGLNELSAWVSDPAILLGQGIDFYRIRGTPKAVDDGLDMIGYGATVEEAAPRRRLWNKFQILLDRIRTNENPDLDHIAGITQFAVAERSKFYRGFRVYDVRTCETSYKKTSESLTSQPSGARIPTNPVLWSFGRRYERDHSLTQAEAQSLGVWIAPSTDTFTWATAIFPWSLAWFPWTAVINTVRKGVMAALLSRLSCYVEFKKANGDVIGYRRAKACHLVQADSNGRYTLASTNYQAAAPSSELVYVDALTGFGDGYGSTAATAALRFGATPTDLTKPGALWVQPGELTMPMPAVASRTVSIEFGRTVRERVCTLLRMPA
jgi:Phage tail protein (Tail_P2_I)